MSKKIISFEIFSRECEHQNDKNDIYAECLHHENHGENCIESGCPLIGLASLADVKRLDPDSYKEEAMAFSEELGRGEDEEELLPCDKGSDLVIYNECE